MMMERKSPQIILQEGEKPAKKKSQKVYFFGTLRPVTIYGEISIEKKINFIEILTIL